MSDNRPSNSLLSCPHCAATADGGVVRMSSIWEEHDDCCEVQQGHGNSWAVVCDYNRGGCGASGPYDITQAEAIERWNRRPSEPPNRSSADHWQGQANLWHRVAMENIAALAQLRASQPPCVWRSAFVDKPSQSDGPVVLVFTGDAYATEYWDCVNGVEHIAWQRISPFTPPTKSEIGAGIPPDGAPSMPAHETPEPFLAKQIELAKAGIADTPAYAMGHPDEKPACQHDLLAPNPTVTVDPTDPFAAHCDACGYKWRTRSAGEKPAKQCRLGGECGYLDGKGSCLRCGEPHPDETLAGTPGFPPETPKQERSMRRDRYPPRDPGETGES